MEKYKTKILVEAGIFMAIAYVLSFIILYEMPQGGSVNAVAIAPLLFYSFRWGWKNGVVMASTYGLFHFLIGAKYTLHPLSVVLDYLLGYGVLGLVGIANKRLQSALMATIGVCFLRWCSSVVSGALIFSAYAPVGTNPWVYSMVYNTAYLLPEGILVFLVVAKFYRKIVCFNQ